MKYKVLIILMITLSCAKKKGSENDITSKTEESFKIHDKSVKFLWTEDIYEKDTDTPVPTTFVNNEYCKTISEAEKAAIGFVAFSKVSDQDWQGNPDDEILNSKINTALNLGDQCSTKHLNFLKKWFKNDKKSLDILQDCLKIPFTASFQESLENIYIKTKGDTIKITSKVLGYNIHGNDGWDFIQEDTFILKKDNLVLIKSKESKRNEYKMMSEEGENEQEAEAEKELRYLFFGNGGLVGYFSDGTKAGCPRCDFCKSNIEELFAQESMGAYTNEEVVNEINEGGTEGWALIDYKWKIKVPQF